MNIFVLDYDLNKNAQYYTDKHVNKMISEYAQMLSTAIYIQTGYIVTVRDIEKFKTLYSKCTPTIKPTHVNHPCNKWVRESQQNYDYLFSMLETLNDEWKYRGGHTQDHGSYFKFIDGRIDISLPSIGLTPFVQAMPIQYYDRDAVTAYRNYYKGDKQHLFKWTKRDVPVWISKTALSITEDIN
jgi:hypothetical protein